MPGLSHRHPGVAWLATDPVSWLRWNCHTNGRGKRLRLSDVAFRRAEHAVKNGPVCKEGCTSGGACPRAPEEASYPYFRVRVLLDFL